MESDEEEFNSARPFRSNSKRCVHHTEDFTESGATEFCDTCSGDTDDIISICSWTTDNGDMERCLGPEIADEVLSAPGANDQTVRAEATVKVSPNACPAMSQMQYDYFGYVPVWVPMVALPATAWSDVILPNDKGTCNMRPTIPGESVKATWPVARRHRQRAPRSGPGHARRGLGQVASRVDRSLQVQQKKGEDDLEARDGPKEAPTTICLRNFPTVCTRDMLLNIMDAEGFSGEYDFVHMPVDFQTKIALGYAVVNMVTNSAALRFLQHFQGFERWPVGAQQACEVSWNSPSQGLAAQIDRYRNSPLMHHSVPETYRPVLLRNGVRVDFPAPTSRICKPRIRHQKPRNEM